MTSLAVTSLYNSSNNVPTTGKYGFDIEDDKMEIGIGIHGEKGIHREEVKDIDHIVGTSGGSIAIPILLISGNNASTRDLISVNE